MENCVFCKIVRRVAEVSIVQEDDTCLAFLDLFPVHSGHTLVVPRDHVADLSSCPKDLACHLFGMATELAPVITEVSGADGFNVWTANGTAAGQEVLHLHLHILPRFKGDAFGLRFPKGYPAEAGRAELEAMAEKIRSKVRK
ncbi:MAG: HIT family protein [Gemmatimonadales bacterium]